MENLAIVKSPENEGLVRISKQIAIVNKLLANVNHDKVIQFLSDNELFFTKLISKNFALDEKLLLKYSDDFDWKELPSNLNIIWTKEIIKRFSNRLNLVSISWFSKNPTDILSLNEIDPRGLSKNENINWSFEFIEANIQRLDFDYLSGNPALPWSFDFIEYYKDYWNWGPQSGLKQYFSLETNPGLPWSEELIEKYFDKWDWKQLSKNKGLPWSIEFIERYESKWEWGIGGLSFNHSLPWTFSLIEKFAEKWHWGNRGLSSNASLPWSISLIEKYIEKWDWGSSALSVNQGLPWSIQFLRRYRDKWNEEGLSKNNGIIWTESMINEVRSWGYSEINPYSSRNSPWNIDYIIMNYDFLDFHKVYEYPGLWQNVFKDTLNYEKVSQLIEANKKKKSYKVFDELKQLDVMFDDFLSKKDPSLVTVITKAEIILLKQYFKNKKKLYDYINSEKAYNDYIENRKSIREFQNLVDEITPKEIKSILLRRVNDKFIFPQEHEIMDFLTTQLTLPNYLQDITNGNKKSNSQNTMIDWLKKKFS